MWESIYFIMIFKQIGADGSLDGKLVVYTITSVFGLKIIVDK